MVNSEGVIAAVIKLFTQKQHAAPLKPLVSDSVWSCHPRHTLAQLRFPKCNGITL